MVGSTKLITLSFGMDSLPKMSKFDMFDFNEINGKFDMFVAKTVGPVLPFKHEDVDATLLSHPLLYGIPPQCSAIELSLGVLSKCPAIRVSLYIFSVVFNSILNCLAQMKS